MGRASKVQPHRFRFNFPVADDSVREWMEGQYDHSASLRLLIRESIQRDGFVDVVNRPVTQLPKRGRPSTGSSLEDDEDLEPPQPQPRRAPLPEPAPVAEAAPVAPETQEPDAEPVDPEPVATAPEPVETTIEDDEENLVRTPVPVDVNDMFAQLR